MKPLGIEINYYWLALGILLVALECIGLSGLGLFFAGLGAATTAVLVYYDYVNPNALFTQVVTFFATSVAWAILLWRPIQILDKREKKDTYNNIVGETAVVSDTLSKGHIGHVTWSGTTMRAELARSSRLERVEPGARVKIVHVEGNKLTVDATDA